MANGKLFRIITDVTQTFIILLPCVCTSSCCCPACSHPLDPTSKQKIVIIPLMCLMFYIIPVLIPSNGCRNKHDEWKVEIWHIGDVVDKSTTKKLSWTCLQTWVAVCGYVKTDQRQIETALSFLDLAGFFLPRSNQSVLFCRQAVDTWYPPRQIRRVCEICST